MREKITIIILALTVVFSAVFLLFAFKQKAVANQAKYDLKLLKEEFSSSQEAMKSENKMLKLKLDSCQNFN